MRAAGAGTHSGWAPGRYVQGVVPEGNAGGGAADLERVPAARYGALAVGCGGGRGRPRRVPAVALEPVLDAKYRVAPALAARRARVYHHGVAGVEIAVECAPAVIVYVVADVRGSAISCRLLASCGSVATFATPGFLVKAPGAEPARAAAHGQPIATTVHATLGNVSEISAANSVVTAEALLAALSAGEGVAAGGAEGSAGLIRRTGGAHSAGAFELAVPGRLTEAARPAVVNLCPPRN